MADALASESNLLLFAREDGGLVGMIGSYPREEPGVADVISMYVTPAARGRGIGRHLLVCLIEELRSYPHIEWLELAVKADQKAPQDSTAPAASMS